MYIRRAVNFDLDVNEMYKVLGSKVEGYHLIYKTMIKMGFIHRQCSGYLSKNPMSYNDVRNTLHNLAKANPWMSQCIKVLDVTDVPNSGYDFTNYVIQECEKEQILQDIREKSEKSINQNNDGKDPPSNGYDPKDLMEEYYSYMSNGKYNINNKNENSYDGPELGD